MRNGGESGLKVRDIKSVKARAGVGDRKHTQVDERPSPSNIHAKLSVLVHLLTSSQRVKSLKTQGLA